jgi:hypothetical protein
MSHVWVTISHTYESPLLLHVTVTSHESQSMWWVTSPRSITHLIQTWTQIPTLPNVHAHCTCTCHQQELMYIQWVLDLYLPLILSYKPCKYCFSRIYKSPHLALSRGQQYCTSTPFICFPACIHPFCCCLITCVTNKVFPSFSHFWHVFLMTRSWLLARVLLPTYAYWW